MPAETPYTYEFACGDVLPGCAATFTGESLPSLFGEVQEHALAEHGISPVPPDVLALVSAAVRTR